MLALCPIKADIGSNITLTVKKVFPNETGREVKGKLSKMSMILSME